MEGEEMTEAIIVAGIRLCNSGASSVGRECVRIFIVQKELVSLKFMVTCDYDVASSSDSRYGVILCCRLQGLTV